ncbi:MAG: GAF domain-containing protein [Deltaproteobacteria bacterium]|nr:GAF domain-containing protein [Deltaproteobacteria bacterium]
MTDEAKRGGLSRLADLMAVDGRFAADVVSRPHQRLLMVRRGERFVTFAPGDVWDDELPLLRPTLEKVADANATIILLGKPRELDLASVLAKGVFSILPPDVDADLLFVTVHTAFEHLETKARAESRGKWLQRYRYELGELIEIARSLTTERDLDKLLPLVLEKARFVTGADAGSIYVVEGDDGDIGRRMLRFKTSQNDSLDYQSREFTLPISNRSITGSVALSKSMLNIPDVYELPPGTPYGFDRSFDQRMGYRSKSMLVAPMVSAQGEIIGVLQLINRKKDPRQKLRSAAEVEDQVLPFDDRSEELMSSLAAQAGIALENAILYAEINRIFAGFVTASVEAIEQRDPTTSGHSRRVATLTVALADVVDREVTGPYADVQFSTNDLREVEIASLLHDFGKIGVREEVLVKAKKLFAWQLDSIRRRLDFAGKAHEADALARRCRLMERGASREELAALDLEIETRRQELSAAWNAIVAANEPTVLKAGDFRVIEEIARQTYTDMNGDVHPLLTASEIKSLSITRGSLTTSEIDEIRSHVVHTRSFLSQIPWGRAFRRIPEIAGCHHEKLNGSGYPNRLKAEEIPLQSKLMSISDIFDALTASDRPYKRAVPVDRACDILGYEVKDGALDAELVRLFVEARVWERLGEEPPASRFRLA